MNWRARYEEIKVGDRVRCIDNPNRRRIRGDRERGSGWRLGYIFVISVIQTEEECGVVGGWEGQTLLWEGYSGWGVWSDNVEKVLE